MSDNILQLSRVEERLKQDKKACRRSDFKNPNISLSSEQFELCWHEQKKSCSVRNFAARAMMKLYDHKDLYMRNCTGRYGKGKIPDEYQQTVLSACYTFYGDTMNRDPEGEWKGCITAIDKRLRNCNGKSAHRYKTAKLNL